LENASKDDAEAETCVECPLEHLYGRLKTGPEGLTSSEAAERLRQSGMNVLPEKEKHRLQSILVQFKNMFNVLLIVAAILSFISGFTSNDIGSINMGIVILVVVLISVIFSLFQEYRAEKAVEAIKELIPNFAKVTRDGQMKQVTVSEVVPGDLINLEAGDKVPADARVVNCYELTVDNSSLTGESEAQSRSAVPSTVLAKGDMISCANLVFAGTTVASGSGTAIVIATGEKTEFGRVVAISHEIIEPLSPLQLELNRTAKMNFVVAIAVGVLFLLIAFFGLHLELSMSLLFMIGVVISLVPEGFQVTLTLALALSSLAMSKRNVVVKRLSSVETLGSVTVICTDKTGTITEGQMTVRTVWIGGTSFEVSGEGYEPEGSIFLNGKRSIATDRQDLMRLCEIASLDNTATVIPPLDRRKSRWTAIGDSTEAALLVFATKAGLQNKEELGRQPRIGMIPFESNRKMMSSIHKTKSGSVAYVKGAGFEILSRCTHIYWDKRIVPLTESLSKAVKDQIDAFARDAFRVLALAYRELPVGLVSYSSDSVETQLTFVGLVAILDPPRAETTEAVRQARGAGTKVIMMTGDHELTAEAIARKVGIITTSKDAVMTGYTLAAISDEELDRVLDKPELVFARISPDQKLRIVHRLREKGEKVAVTGDGVNDTPALLEADIGIAMGISGTDVARESADMVLLDDNFASIVHGIEQGRAVFDNLKKFIVYVFAHNWAELLTFIVFVLLGTPLPLTVLMVLAIDLMMEIPPSLGLTVEPPEPGIMDRPPRSKKERLFSASALARSAYIGIIIGAMATFWCFQTWSISGWTLGTNSIGDYTIYLQGTTITMAAIMAGQLGTLFATRTNIKSTFSVSLSKNKWIVVGAVTSFALLLATIYLPFINTIIATSPIPPTDLILLYSIAPVIILLEEVRKYLLRTYYIPARPVMAFPAIPLPSRSLSTLSTGTRKRQTPFVEKSQPFAMLIDANDWLSNEIFISFSVAKQNGSRLIFIRLIDEGVDGKALEKLEQAVDERSSYLGVPCEYMDLHLSGKEQSPRTIASSVREAIKRINPERIILPTERGVFEGKRSALRKISWVEEFQAKKVMLISNWRAATFGPNPPRLLIPILGEFNEDVFDLAEALTTDANVPDVDIVAAKVIEMPRIVPLYSYYKPESLINADKELAAIKSLPRWAVIRRIRPMVLLVREAGRDLVQFAEERKVDVMVLEGDWSAKGRGYLRKKEQAIASQAQCTVVVILPMRELQKAGN
jgi:Ca2+-transporting ATPase